MACRDLAEMEEKLYHERMECFPEEGNTGEFGRERGVSKDSPEESSDMIPFAEAGGLLGERLKRLPRERQAGFLDALKSAGFGAEHVREVADEDVDAVFDLLREAAEIIAVSQHSRSSEQSQRLRAIHRQMRDAFNA